MHMSITELNTFKDLKKEIINEFADQKKVTIKQKARIKRLQTKYKKKIYIGLLYKLTNIYFEEKEAKEIWLAIIIHRESLQKKLKREIDIEVAVLDYFIECQKDLIDNPLIIEEKIFEAIKKRVLIDELTGLYNYRFFKHRIKEEISKSKRYKNPFSIIMIDIDDFKKYNDSYGHMEGNDVLKRIANLLKKLLRSTDVIIRFGGEEFLVILPQIAKKQALLVADKIRSKVSELRFKSSITISGGVATYLSDTKSNENTLIRLADLALYRAKYEGKNRICNYPKERRSFKRIPLNESIKVKIKCIPTNKALKPIGNIRNISFGGISIYQNKKLKNGDMVEGNLMRKKQKLPFQGEVIWVSKIEEELFELGIKFTNINPKQLKAFPLEKS